MGLFPLPLIYLGPNYGGGNEDNGDLLQKVPCRHCYTQCPQPCSRPLLTYTSARDCWTFMGKSGSVSRGVTAPFSWVLVSTKVLFVLSKRLSNYLKHIHHFFFSILIVIHVWFYLRGNTLIWGFQGGSVVKNPPDNARDLGSIPESGRSPGVGNGNPFQYSSLENSMDWEAWWATVHGVTKSQNDLATKQQL